MDNRDEYDYGSNQRGKKFYALISGTRKGKINMIVVYRNEQLIAPITVDASCNRIIFESWITTRMIPYLKPGQYLILDNATFDKGGNIRTMVEEAGCQLLYLPPYSPDFNKLEQCWSWLKSHIRRCLDKFNTLRDAMEHILMLASL